MPENDVRELADAPTKPTVEHHKIPPIKTLAEEWFWRNYSPTDRNRDILRNQFINQFGFAVLDSGAVELIKSYGPILEVGAGLGYWTHELKQAGIDIVATDPDTRSRWPGITPWTRVEKLNALDAISKYPGRNLLTSWPDRDAPWAAEALMKFQGDRVIYVGENDSGCTGTPEMFIILRFRFQQEKCYEIPTFHSMSDRLEVWRRKD